MRFSSVKACLRRRSLGRPRGTQRGTLYGGVVVSGRWCSCSGITPADMKGKFFAGCPGRRSAACSRSWRLAQEEPAVSHRHLAHAGPAAATGSHDTVGPMRSPFVPGPNRVPLPLFERPDRGPARCIASGGFGFFAFVRSRRPAALGNAHAAKSTDLVRVWPAPRMGLGRTPHARLATPRPSCGVRLRKIGTERSAGAVFPGDRYCRGRPSHDGEGAAVGPSNPDCVCPQLHAGGGPPPDGGSAYMYDLAAGKVCDHNDNSPLKRRFRGPGVTKTAHRPTSGHAFFGQLPDESLLRPPLRRVRCVKPTDLSIPCRSGWTDPTRKALVTSRWSAR